MTSASKPLYIAVAGTIGAGKSSLVKWLCQHYQLSQLTQLCESGKQ